jgi:hypothetical protein
MKRLLVLAMVALHVVTATAAEVTIWATAVSKQESTGRVIVFRYAKAFREGFQKASFPDRIILVWRYKSEKSMPVTSEREAMDRMEDLLEPLVEKSGQSILALVSTGEDLREWIFYAKSEQEFLATLNQALAGQPRFPIEVHAAPDPEWSTYERFRKGVRE